MTCPKVSIIVVNWNGKEETLECLDSLKQLDYPHYEIIVVDNGSNDGSQVAIRSAFPEVRLLENGRNLGYGAAVNAGVEAALRGCSDYVLPLNNDLVLDGQSLQRLVEVAEADPTTGMTCPKLYWYDTPNKICSVGFKVDLWFLLQLTRHRGVGEEDLGQWDQLTEVDAAGIFLVKRQVVEAVGAFDPEYFLHLEDFDWCMRARRAGYRIVYVPSAVMWHKGSVSMGGGLSPQVVYYVTRNRFLLWQRHFNKAQRLGLLFLFLMTTVPIRVGFYSFGFTRKHVRAFLKGIGHGLGKFGGPA